MNNQESSFTMLSGEAVPRRLGKGRDSSQSGFGEQGQSTGPSWHPDMQSRPGLSCSPTTPRRTERDLGNQAAGKATTRERKTAGHPPTGSWGHTGGKLREQGQLGEGRRQPCWH